MVCIPSTLIVFRCLLYFRKWRYTPSPKSTHTSSDKCIISVMDIKHAVRDLRLRCYTLVGSVRLPLDFSYGNQGNNFLFGRRNNAHHAMPHNNLYVLYFARTGLVTAPCSTISQLRSDDSPLYNSPSRPHASIQHKMEFGSYFVRSYRRYTHQFRSLLSHKSSLASFLFLSSV